VSLWLTHEELVELTDYKQRDKQIETLVELGVKFRVRKHDNFPIVDRYQFMPPTKRREPNFGVAGV
jgi:hypothetical protein